MKQGSIQARACFPQCHHFGFWLCSYLSTRGLCVSWRASDCSGARPAKQTVPFILEGKKQQFSNTAPFLVYNVTLIFMSDVRQFLFIFLEEKNIFLFYFYLFFHLYLQVHRMIIFLCFVWQDTSKQNQNPQIIPVFQSTKEMLHNGCFQTK